jgi:hypothetical protein
MVRPDVDLWLQQDVDKDILECRMRVLVDYIKYLEAKLPVPEVPIKTPEECDGN